MLRLEKNLFKINIGTSNPITSNKRCAGVLESQSMSGRMLPRTPRMNTVKLFTTVKPKAKIEVAVADERLDEVVEAIINSAKTGKVGDGKIFVSTLDQVWRIRTGETGDSAL